MKSRLRKSRSRILMAVCTTAFLTIGWNTQSVAQVNVASKPNIVYILADDMGLGDVRSYTPTDVNNRDVSPVNTVNIDRIANGGMKFTNAHSCSGVCTPTRYGIMTGRYAWRTSLKKEVIWQDDPPLIEPSRTTVAEMLKSEGYRTGAFGKWHLGKAGSGTSGDPFTGGPTDHGFDTYFGDDVPGFYNYYMRDDQKLVKGTDPYKIYTDLNTIETSTAGPDDVAYERNSLPALTAEAVNYIGQNANNPENDPFFLYMPLNAPHAPVYAPTWMEKPAGSAPNDGNAGSQKNRYEMFVAAVDWSVGKVLDELDAQGIADDTVIIFATDNGAARYDSKRQESTGFGHNGDSYRGQKSAIYEGGNRVPLIVQWTNGGVTAGGTSSEYVELNDFYRTVADALGVDVGLDAAEDSYSIMPILQGETLSNPLREAGVNHSGSSPDDETNYATFAIRQVDENGDEWKLIYSDGSGGYLNDTGNPIGTPLDVENLPTIEASDYGSLQLYNLTDDPGELNNLLADEEGVSSFEIDKINHLHTLLRGYMESGRSAPVPEPSSVLLVGLGIFGLSFSRRKRR